MSDPAVHDFLAKAHAAAMAMLENASYVQGELDAVSLSDGHRARAEEVCLALLGAKHDVVHDLSEMDDLLAAGEAPKVLRARAERIADRLRGEASGLHALVLELQEARGSDVGKTLAYVLVSESAANILRAIHEASEALAAIPSGGD